jgi:hypothetical protein
MPVLVGQGAGLAARISYRCRCLRVEGQATYGFAEGLVHTALEVPPSGHLDDFQATVR